MFDEQRGVFFAREMIERWFLRASWNGLLAFLYILLMEKHTEDMLEFH
jgi:hypothetical protein